jgi:hypothetical protein
LLRRAARPPLPATVLEVADQFLLFGVHRDHRLAVGQASLRRRIDELELGIAVGVAVAFLGLGLPRR